MAAACISIARAGVSPLDIARRVVAEHAAGNTEFRVADAYQLADGSVREMTRNDLALGGL